MKKLDQMVREQAEYCRGLRENARAFAEDINRKIVNDAVLLSGSASRGDARQGRYGLLVDLTLVTPGGDTDLSKTYGASTEPGIPFYCTVFSNTGFQIKQVSRASLTDTSKPESECFALAESIVLGENDTRISGELARHYPKKQAPRKETAMQNFRRFRYLCGDYRYEKWEWRQAYTQMAQNFHEAFECFCGFIYAVNGSFIPRKDWLVYLLPEQEIRPEGIDSLTEALLGILPNQNSIEKGKLIYQAVGEWMESSAKELGWI
ncbi:MAG: hypothetical protein A2Y33_00850 [Spirochaetes bacterium GWF1_51_8]|nr:MAG: hypothetical protein A2Y33_00850 [Spirochaetes bacterium GWF1_51_8]